MVTCPSCGIAQEGSFCTKCGTPLCAQVTAPPALADPPPIYRPNQAAMGVAAEVHHRITSTTCPRCGAGMAVVIRRSGLGLALIVIGLLTTPLFCIGVPIFAVGFVMRFSGKGRAVYQCPGCNYTTG
jgi:hypothetical protein